MRIGVLVQDGCLGSGVTAVVDLLRVAQIGAAAVDPSIPPFELAVLGRRRVTTSEGFAITTDDRAGAVSDHDVIVVPALASFSGRHLDRSIEAPCGRAAVRALRSLDLDRTSVAAACTGVFTVAASGVLDGRRATTSWFLAQELSRRYPDVTLDVDEMVVRDGPLLTAGAAFAHIDLALTLIGDVSPGLAAQVGETMLVDRRTSQGAYLVHDRIAHDDDMVRRFERHVRDHLAEPLDVASICRDLGVSRRTLERRTRAAVAATPLGVIHRLRIERARHLQRTTDLSTQAIAGEVGYANAETLRALLRRHRTSVP